MAYAVELYFDPEADARVRRIWSAIADAGLPQPMLNDVFSPHVTLGVCDQLDLSTFARPLQEFCATTTPLPMALDHIGIFNTTEGVIFFAPTVTQALLELHIKFHDLFAQFAQYASNRWRYYLPGVWAPHCTLAFKLDANQLGQALRIAMQVQLPITLEARRLCIVEVNVPNPRELVSFDLG